VVNRYPKTRREPDTADDALLREVLRVHPRATLRQ